MSFHSRPLRLFLIVLLITVGALVAMGWAMRHAQRLELAAEAARGHEQLGLYANSLHTLIERYRALPSVLALDPQLIEALRGPVDAATQDALNRKLERINGTARSSTLELLDRDGLAVAASNWRLPASYVGQNYAFRPYFQQTRTQGSGRFYAVGVTSGIAGYFLSSAVKDEHFGFLGAMVVKLESPELEREWSDNDDLLLVSDARGIVFLASQPGWRYRELRPLTTEDRQALARTRQYDRQSLSPLVHERLKAFAPNSHWVSVEGPEGRADYLWNSLPLIDEGWTLHLLRKSSQTGQNSYEAALGAAGLWLSLVFSLLFVNQRWRLARVRKRSREELERLVAERTAALRTAQEGLVQSAKLAALGQMSAALAHEINQPLTAQRMQLASLRLLLEHDRVDEARQALGALEQMLARMAALTGHLKTFARKSPAGLRERLDLSLVVDQALHLMQARLRDEHIQVTQRTTGPAWVRGDAIRLEQVLINLLRNALDAMSDSARKYLTLGLRADNGQWHLWVADSGGGIAKEHLACVFDPFFTTKPVGEGLGLGLAVSCAIVHELGGRLSVANGDDGAVFTLSLPIDPEPPC